VQSKLVLHFHQYSKKKNRKEKQDDMSNLREVKCNICSDRAAVFLFTQFVDTNSFFTVETHNKCPASHSTCLLVLNTVFAFALSTIKFENITCAVSHTACMGKGKPEVGGTNQKIDSKICASACQNKQKMVQ